MTSAPAVVLGATGYVGGELLRLIAAHPLFDLAAAVSESRAGETLGGTFPHLAGALAIRLSPRTAHGWTASRQGRRSRCSPPLRMVPPQQ